MEKTPSQPKSQESGMLATLYSWLGRSRTPQKQEAPPLPKPEPTLEEKAAKVEKRLDPVAMLVRARKLENTTSNEMNKKALILIKDIVVDVNSVIGQIFMVDLETLARESNDNRFEGKGERLETPVRELAKDCALYAMKNGNEEAVEFALRALEPLLGPGDEAREIGDYFLGKRKDNPYSEANGARKLGRTPSANVSYDPKDVLTSVEMPDPLDRVIEDMHMEEADTAVSKPRNGEKSERAGRLLRNDVAGKYRRVVALKTAQVRRKPAKPKFIDAKTRYR